MHDTNCNNMVVTVTDTIMHDNISGTKCNTIVFTALLLWSYPGNGAKRDTVALTVLNVVLSW